MALMLNVFYFIIFCTIYCVKSKKSHLKDICPGDQKFQSPINIPCGCHKETFPPLQLENFNSSTNITITNNGHTLMTMLAPSASIRGGPLKNAYNFAQVHFHWGRCDKEGSEHQIHGKKFPMEGHFVFSRSYEKNTNPQMEDCTYETESTKCHVEEETVKRTESGNQCDNVTKSSTKDDVPSKQNVTINVVLGVFFVISKKTPRYGILKKAKKVVDGNSQITEKCKFINQFVSLMNLSNYFTYSGSLTTPPYSTNVIWIVLRDPLPVSRKQLALLRKLKSTEHGLITHNFRGIQQLYDRVVCCSNGELIHEPVDFFEN